MAARSTPRTVPFDQFDAHVLGHTANGGSNCKAEGKGNTPTRNRLAGRLCVVGGASGIVGSGICRQLLMEGANVVALLRNEDRIKGLLKECQGAPVENLHPVVLQDASKEEQVARCIAEVVAEHGEIDHAVSCFGAWWQGGLLTDQSYDEFSRVIANFAGSHFVFTKSVLPAMRKAESSSFLFITGGVGKRVLSADSGLATVGGAAVYGIVRAAQAQFAESQPHIHEMRIYALVTRHGETPRMQAHFVRNLRGHSNRKVGNMAADLLLSSVNRECLEVTSEKLDATSLVVGD